LIGQFLDIPGALVELISHPDPVPDSKFLMYSAQLSSLWEPAGSTVRSTRHSTCPKREKDKGTPIAGRHFIFFVSKST
jgi:hypothetical protein